MSYCGDGSSVGRPTRQSSAKMSEHVTSILESIRLNFRTDFMVKLVAESGDIFSVPLQLLSLAWPGLKNIVQDVCCCYETVISVPANKQTVEHILSMIYTGRSSPATSLDLEAVRNVCKEVGLNCDIGLALDDTRSDSIPESFIVTECFGDEDGDYDDEDTFQDELQDVLFDENISLEIECQSMLCARSCRNKCPAITQSWSEADLQNVKTMFKSEKVIETKTKLINHLEAQKNIGVRTDSFCINGHHFCVKFLSITTSISEYIVSKVLEDYSSGIRMYEHGSKGVLQQQSLATTQFICWFKLFSEIYGQYAPDDNVTILAYWLKKAALFNIYKEEAPAPHVAQATFFAHMKTYFGPRRIDKTLPCVRISKYTTHSVCDICVALNTNQRQCRTEEALKVAKSLRNQHRMDFGQARRSVEEIKQTAITFPEDNLFVQIDGMDNSKSYLPRFLEHSKELAGTERLPSKIQGCIITSGFYETNQKVLFFINHDHFGKHCLAKTSDTF